MDANALFFEPLKEPRGRYFVEYRPPQAPARFATLQLVFLGQTEIEEVANTMVAEADRWLARYAIPVMASTFDDTGTLIRLKPARACDHLFAVPACDGATPKHSWRLLVTDELPREVEDADYLRRIYWDVPLKTSHQLRADSERRARDLRAGWIIFFVWLVIVPAVVAILGFASRWVGAAAVLYSLCKAIVKGLKLAGKWRSSPAETERREEERLMQHHHYHCKLNPEAFRRLMLENLDAEEREAIRREAEMLKSARPADKSADADNGTQPDADCSGH